MIETLQSWVGIKPFFFFLIVLVGPLVALARAKRIYPHRPLVYVALVLAMIATPVVFRPQLLWILGAANAAVLTVVLLDLLTLPTASTLRATRQVGRIASLGKIHRVTLTVTSTSRRKLTVWIRDDVPEPLDPTPGDFALRLPARSRSTVHYELKPSKRGAFELECVHLRARSLLGMWQRFYDPAERSLIHVYPDMQQLAEYAVLARTNRLSLMGMRRTRRIGQNNEFERLRDYTLDDNYKHIDWRATARRNKLTVKDFQANQSQRLIFLIDCGRMMTNDAGGVSLLDHALNAMLMLSYVALGRGDSVGMIAFSDEVHRFVPPGSGRSQMNMLLHASFDQFPRLVESRYDQAFLYLATHCRKRALVVLISNIVDEVNSHQIEQYLSNLVGRHLPLGVLLRDRRLFDAADQQHPTGRRLFQAAAAAEILTWRHQVLGDLQGKGVLAMDIFPEEMTASLVNRYLDIKARHLL